ncbi:unnamed protein product [Prunus armeniaca]
MFLSRRIHQAYSTNHILKAIRHPTSSFSTEGKEARMSMSIVSLMLWDHMLVIIISSSESFQKALPIVLYVVHDIGTRLHSLWGRFGRFWDLALDCCDEKDEEALVEICISNIVVDYNVCLENIGISLFSRLLEAVRKISMSVKLTRQEAWRSEETEAH